MSITAVEQALAHKVEAYEKQEGGYQLVMHTDTLIAILNGTKTGADNPGVFDTITQDNIPGDVLMLHGASIHLDDRVLAGAVNRRPC